MSQPPRQRTPMEEDFAEAVRRGLGEKKKVVSPDDAGEAHTGWARNPTVNEIWSYKGSAEFWMPIRQRAEEYAGLKKNQKEKRKETLENLSLDIDRWHAHQKAKWGFSGDSDKLKAAALEKLSAMISAELAELGGPSLPEPEVASGSPPASAPVTPEKKKVPVRLPEGWKDSVPGGPPRSAPVKPEKEASSDEDLVLVPNVMLQEVKALSGDQRNCRVVMKGGRLWTHDELFPIDSGGAKIRYVVLAEGMQPVLYASQAYSERGGEDALFASGGGGEPGGGGGKSKGVPSLGSDYPVLTSHAQISGNAIGAGDMVVSDGRITSINNQSGTWQPKGANLARTIQLLVDMGLLSEDAIVKGEVTVSQYLHAPQGLDVDAGQLKALIGGIISIE